MIFQKHNFFKRHSSVYGFAQNDKTQNMDEPLMLLRQRSKEMLEEQDKADLYDIKEKIRYETRNTNVKVYLDVCLQNLTTLYPACGSANSAVCLTLEELEKASCFEKYIDVCIES